MYQATLHRHDCDIKIVICPVIPVKVQVLTIVVKTFIIFHFVLAVLLAAARKKEVSPLSDIYRGFDFIIGFIQLLDLSERML